MEEYVSLDKQIEINDVNGRTLSTTVRHILDINHARYDVLPVVRCKECKMWNTEWNHEAGDCYCYKFFQFTDPDFFCAAGERRANDE